MEKLFDSIQTLALFVCFFLPGFVSLKVYDVLIAAGRRDFSKSIYEVIAYSTLNNALLFPLTRWIFQNATRANPYVVWPLAVLAFVVLPTLWPFLWVRLIKTGPFSSFFVDPVTSPWDYVFEQGKPYWIIVHLKDLRKIGGVFAERSFASSGEGSPQIFLEKVWELDDSGHFVKPVEDSEGIIILESEILAVELLRYNVEAESSDGTHQDSTKKLAHGPGRISAEAG